MNKYLLRLDDACPTMDHERWNRAEFILDKYGIKPLVGVIPANADPEQNIESPDLLFWEKVRQWEKKGWAIALHGYDHCYISKDRGINPLWDRSEFAGLPLEIQKDKITKGIDILRHQGINPKYFFAPSHTFDLNTLKALEECSDIRIISDTIGTEPYRDKGFIFIPQLGGQCRRMQINGTWTFCLHPSVMDDKSFKKLDDFLSKYNSQFISFSTINYEAVRKKSVKSKLLSFSYFSLRKIRKMLK